MDVQLLVQYSFCDNKYLTTKSKALSNEQFQCLFVLLYYYLHFILARVLYT